MLLYRKGDPSQLINYRPIALANTIYKFYTSTLTSILSAYGEKHQILHESQEGFRAKRGTSKQLQLLIAALEDARFTNQDIYIYILYIDFKNSFGSIDHARLLAIMKDLGCPSDAIHLIGNITHNLLLYFMGNILVKPYLSHSKKHNTRRYPEPIPIYNILRTAPSMVTTR